jgi:UDP-glucuronate 4-epimerase
MILLTGIAGFIGSHLAERLLSSEHQIIGLDNLCDFYEIELKKYNIGLINEKSQNGNFVFIQDDILNQKLLESIFEKYKIDSVIHLAAMAGVRPSIENPVLYQKVNVQGTQNLLECCKKFGVKKFIFASSSSIYGNNKKIPFSEDDRVDNPISPYAATKKAGELLCYTYHYLYDIDIACLRFFTVYGPRQRPDLAIHKFSKLITKGEKIPFYGDGTTARDYTFIDDIIDGVEKCFQWLSSQKNAYEIFNLGNSEPIELERLVSLIAKHLHYGIKIERMPVPKGDVNFTYADITKAQKYFDYKHKTDIEEGLQKFFDWFKSYYKSNPL